MRKVKGRFTVETSVQDMGDGWNTVTEYLLINGRVERARCTREDTGEYITESASREEARAWYASDRYRSGC